MPPSPLELLRTHLLEQADHGVTHLRLSEAARETLWPSRPVAVAKVSPAPPAQQPRAVSPQPTTPLYTPPAPQPGPTVMEAPSPSPASATHAPSREELLQKLREEAATSERCKALGTFRDIMVFAVGNSYADIMFVGEAPGAEEEKQREPFVGPAGQLLTKIIQAMGPKRSDVYISNICKYRPAMEDDRPQGARNRPPTADEMASCLPFIKSEIEIIQPKVIVALGSTASTGLGFEGSVSRLRGSFREFQGTPVMTTYHPSYLLRCEDQDGGGIREKRLVWEDMLLVMERVGLPISEKQRAYFTKARS